MPDPHPGVVETIQHGGACLAMIIPASYQPAATSFLTPPELSQQVGFICYPRGGRIARHAHRRAERRFEAASEVLLIRQGRCELDVYGPDKQLVATRELGAGDLVVLMAGGHGFRMLEDTVLVEVKLGPYLGAQDKELF